MWIAVSAIATAIYAVFAIFQWLAIREQANLISRNLDITSRAVDAANRNATAAFEGAKAATLSAEIARDTLYLTQAADIQLADTWWNQADPSVSGMPDAIITAVFKNFGNSAARNVLLDVTLGIPGRPYSLNETPSPPINLAPQQTVNMGSELCGRSSRVQTTWRK